MLYSLMQDDLQQNTKQVYACSLDSNVCCQHTDKNTEPHVLSVIAAYMVNSKDARRMLTLIDRLTVALAHLIS